MGKLLCQISLSLCLPSEASVGAAEIRLPRRSGRATSVMYTIAGDVPIAEPSPVSMRPINNSAILDAFAIKIQPQTHGIAANFIVFNRPIHSINIAANKQPTGTDNTITDAIHDVCCFVNFKSLSSLSTCGTKIAENDNEMPITMWNDAAVTAAKIYSKSENVSFCSCLEYK